MNSRQILEKWLTEEHLARILKIDNPSLHEFLATHIEHLSPAKVFVGTDSAEDIDYIRKKALENGEEKKLAIEGHTIHFDNRHDQARDKKNTLILLPKGIELETLIDTGDRDTLFPELMEIMKGIMKGKELFVRFFCLGPVRSEFSIPAVQITDSAYVAHSEDILYRQGYEEFVRQGRRANFFKFVHSSGELNPDMTSKNLDKRRVYIDLETETVYSVNTQYGGNTIGLKKLAMRLAIARGAREGWLTEHMLIMGVHGPGGRKTYFTGAFPSLCGKTSTAMLEGETIVGDDIAYLRVRNNRVYAVNVEKGMFGIIQGINSKDDPNQWKTLHEPNEIIFSNVLVDEKGIPYWTGKDGPLPAKGINYAGEWTPDLKDENGRSVPVSHPNARFTVALSAMDNLDPALDNPDGVPVGGIVYGGRDSDTSVPVEESFNWNHGIITKGASLESETTAATLGRAGVRAFNPMSNLDFLSIPVGRYVKINLEFGKKLKPAPRIFSVNYFLTDKNGKFLNEKNDKKVWYKWMELRVNGDVDAIDTPTGRIPYYEDLKKLFRSVCGKEYTPEAYSEQFKTRVRENLEKIERIRKIYETEVLETPSELFEELDAQRARLEKARAMYGDYILPHQYLHGKAGMSVF